MPRTILSKADVSQINVSQINMSPQKMSQMRFSNDYSRILLTYKNLKNVTAVLKAIKFNSPLVTKMRQKTTGYDFILSVLNNGYDPDKDLKSLVSSLQTISQKIPLYETTFLLRVIHIVWMEVNGKLPWTIKSYSNNEINGLFFEPTVNALNVQLIPATGIPGAYPGSCLEDYEPQISFDASYKLHHLALKFLADTKENSFIIAIGGLKPYFFHAYNHDSVAENWGFDKYTGKTPYKFMPVGDNRYPLNLEQLFDERIVGCHEPALILTEMLRSMNIPALTLNPGGHAVVYIPGPEYYIHGDYLACNSIVPVELILFSLAEFIQYLTSNYDYNKILDDKLSLHFTLWQHMILTTGVQRVNSTLYLGFNCKSEENKTILPIVQTEAPQYGTEYDSTTQTLISKAIPIIPLNNL